MRSLSGRALIAACFFASDNATGDESHRLGIGRPVGEADVESWNIDIAIDGVGLPPGRGSVREGRAIYERKCTGCHGGEGRGGPMDQLSGGAGTLASGKPVKTIGSYWPYATTVFDYVRRAMPLDRPQSLAPDEVYALAAYLLHVNGIVGPHAVMDARRLPSVRMPNRAAFRPDPRPDVSNAACGTDCPVPVPTSDGNELDQRGDGR